MAGGGSVLYRVRYAGEAVVFINPNNYNGDDEDLLRKDIEEQIEAGENGVPDEDDIDAIVAAVLGNE